MKYLLVEAHTDDEELWKGDLYHVCCIYNYICSIGINCDIVNSIVIG